MSAITKVTQQCPLSCGVACLAMVACISFEDALSVAGSPTGAGDLRGLESALQRLGVPHELLRYPELGPHSRYVLAVPSLNNRGGMHWIVVETGEQIAENQIVVARIFDPAPPDRDSYEREPLRTWAEVIRITDQPQPTP